MILAPVYCSSDPPPASGPVRSKMTPILIFLSWASAEAAIPSAAPATISPPSRRAALRTSIKTSLENCGLCLLVFIDAHHMGSAGGCQAARPRHSGAPRYCMFKSQNHYRENQHPASRPKPVLRAQVAPPPVANSAGEKKARPVFRLGPLPLDQF